MSDVYVYSVAAMDTVVTIQVIGHAVGAAEAERADAVCRAASWFRVVEDCCSRFDARSELRALSDRIGEPVPVSPMLFETVRFGLALAEETDGAFDPTIGARMEARGFDRNFRSGESRRAAAAAPADVTFRDVRLDADQQTITLLRPLVLDLGAVAKGLAIDMAARELDGFESFAIDAGGDLRLRGTNEDGLPWRVGIRHPRDETTLIETLHLSDVAVCTSGGYERRAAAEGEHHLLDPRSGRSPIGVASATVVAPLAMVADGLSTSAFLLDPPDAIRLLEKHGVEGVIFAGDLTRYATSRLPA